MRKLLVVVGCLLLVLLISGCSFTVYPVEGPIVDSGQARPIHGEYTWDGTGHGKIKLTLPSGEYLEGEYTTIAEGATGYGSFFSSSDYNTYFGHMAVYKDKQYGQAVLYGDKGTVMQAEYYVSGSTGHGFGLGKDNNENIYKMIF